MFFSFPSAEVGGLYMSHSRVGIDPGISVFKIIQAVSGQLCFLIEVTYFLLVCDLWASELEYRLIHVHLASIYRLIDKIRIMV